MIKKKDCLYQYREQWEGEAKPGRYIICGEKGFIIRYIAKKEFAELFGGYCIWKVRKKWYQYDESTIGVYGKRNAGRLRRILKERGAEFAIVDGPQPGTRLKSITRDYRPRLRKLGKIK